MNITDFISSVQPQTKFFVILFEYKSLAVVLEHRSLLQLCLSIGSLLIKFLSIGNLLQLCLSSLKSLARFSREQLKSDITFLVNSL